MANFANLLDLGGSPTANTSAQLKFQAPSSTGGGGGGGSAPSGNTGASGSGASGGSGAPALNNGTSPTSQPSASFNPQSYADQQKSNAQAELDARNAQIRSGISSAYQPIFDAFDQQIGLLPQQQDTANKQVNDLATGQKSDVTSNRDQQVGDLNQNINNEYSTTDTNLAQLNRNVGNMLKAGQFYLGALGAGDSGATNDYLANVTNNVNTTAGQMYQQRDQAVGQIKQKISDVNALASQNLNDIDTWKNNQLTTITQEFQKQLADLTMGKAQAEGQKGKDLVNLQQSALDNYYSRLKQLDDTVYGYNAAISQWQTERAGWLNDQLTLMKQGAQYTSGTNAAQQNQIKTFYDKGTNTSYLYNSATGQYSPVTLPGAGSKNNSNSIPVITGLQNLFDNISGNVSGSGGSNDNSSTNNIVTGQ